MKQKRKDELITTGFIIGIWEFCQWLSRTLDWVPYLAVSAALLGMALLALHLADTPQSPEA